jgi:hypothetical protein
MNADNQRSAVRTANPACRAACARGHVFFEMGPEDGEALHGRLALLLREGSF